MKHTGFTAQEILDLARTRRLPIGYGNWEEGLIFYTEEDYNTNSLGVNTENISSYNEDALNEGTSSMYVSITWDEPSNSFSHNGKRMVCRRNLKLQGKSGKELALRLCAETEK